MERRASRRTARRIPSSPPNSSAAWRASCPTTSPRAADAVRRARKRRRRETIATRKASQQALEAFAHGAAGADRRLGRPDRLELHQLVGQRCRSTRRAARGNYINYGVREFGMAAITNGLALHGGFIPYGGTFLTFSDYTRNAVRMAALMKLRSIYVFTHDSIGLGEDGPTHQSIEHAASLRLIPQLDVWRPCDTVETAVAWARALERSDGPSALLFTRQNVAFATREPAAVADIARGGYVLADFADAADARAPSSSRPARKCRWRSARAKRSRRTASPCASCRCRARSVFDRQDAAYRARVLPHGVPRVAVEAGVDRRLAQVRRRRRRSRRASSASTAIGESAPAPALFKHFGFTVEHVAQAVRDVVATGLVAMTIGIRRATADDAAAIAAVRIDCWRTHVPRPDSRRVPRRHAGRRRAPRCGTAC